VPVVERPDVHRDVRPRRPVRRLMRIATRVFPSLSRTSPRRRTPASDSMLSAAAARAAYRRREVAQATPPTAAARARRSICRAPRADAGRQASGPLSDFHRSARIGRQDEIGVSVPHEPCPGLDVVLEGFRRPGHQADEIARLVRRLLDEAVDGRAVHRGEEARQQRNEGAPPPGPARHGEEITPQRGPPA
jgi:hypothetical protein